MSVSVYTEIVYPTYVRRRYKVTLTDNLGVEHEYILGMYNHQPDNDGSEVEAQQLLNVAEQEILKWRQEMEAGDDPAHIDMGGYFIHSEPLWNTWEIAVDGAVTPFLQADYMQDILYCKLTCSRLTNKELEGIAGKPNDVRAEQTIATNTQTTLDSYIPLIDANGEPRP